MIAILLCLACAAACEPSLLVADGANIAVDGAGSVKWVSAECDGPMSWNETEVAPCTEAEALGFEDRETTHGGGPVVSVEPGVFSEFEAEARGSDSIQRVTFTVDTAEFLPRAPPWGVTADTIVWVDLGDDVLLDATHSVLGGRGDLFAFWSEGGAPAGSNLDGWSALGFAHFVTPDMVGGYHFGVKVCDCWSCAPNAAFTVVSVE